MSLHEAATRLITMAGALKAATKELGSTNPALEPILMDLDCAENDLEAQFHADTTAPSDLREAAALVIQTCADFRNTTAPKTPDDDRTEFMQKLRAMQDSERQLEAVLKALPAG